MKNIVICFDVMRDFSLESPATNSLKLFSALTINELQSAFYIPLPALESGAKGFGEAAVKVAEAAIKFEPIGVMAALIGPMTKTKEWQALKSYALGDAVSKQIAAGIDVLNKNYQHGDRLFIFGCGRAATSAALFAAFIDSFGVILPDRVGDIPELLKRFLQSTINNKPLTTGLFRDIFAYKCTPEFIGLWDCVEQSGMISSPGKFARGPFLPSSQIRHAVAIDERRIGYTPHLFRSDESLDLRKEVWFAGVHSDVIGSYPESESGPSQMSLEWMLQEARDGGVLLDLFRTAALLGKQPSLPGWPLFAKPDPKANLHNSLRGVWWEMEIFPASYWDSEKNRTVFRIPFGRRRHIPSAPFVHPSVASRLAESLTYRPSNLPSNYRVVEVSAPFSVVATPELQSL